MQHGTTKVLQPLYQIHRDLSVEPSNGPRSLSSPHPSPSHAGILRSKPFKANQLEIESQIFFQKDAIYEYLSKISIMFVKKDPIYDEWTRHGFNFSQSCLILQMFGPSFPFLQKTIEITLENFSRKLFSVVHFLSALW